MVTQEDRDLFRSKALAVMSRFGARSVPGNPNHFVLNTRVEDLTLLIGEATIEGLFTNPFRAKIRFRSDARINGETGQWDWNVERDSVDEFEYRIDDMISNMVQY